jgi:hypothetical protein
VSLELAKYTGKDDIARALVQFLLDSGVSRYVEAQPSPESDPILLYSTTSPAIIPLFSVHRKSSLVLEHHCQ